MKTLDKKTAARDLLQQLYGVNRDNGDTVSKIRSWCVTVWMASLALVSSENMVVTDKAKFLFPLLPILLFWVLDAFQNAFIVLTNNRIRRFERIIAEEDYDSAANDEYFFEIGYDKVAYGEKLRSLIRSLFLKETVTVFYLLLLSGTLLFVFVNR